MLSLTDFGFRRGEYQPPGQYGESGSYSRMFPQLSPLFGLETLSEADETIKALNELGEVMVETAEMIKSRDRNNYVIRDRNNYSIPAGYTYLGQFIGHDLTFDPTSIGEMIVDPLARRNYRTPRLDLDNLYGSGPKVQPYLYQRNSSLNRQNSPNQEPVLFKIGQTREIPQLLPSLPNDLPRSPDGLALISDKRNDENLIIAQLHLAFLKFHNKVAQELYSNKELQNKITRKFDNNSVMEDYEIARKLVMWHYQWIVLYDYLPTVTQYTTDEIAQLVKSSSRIHKIKEKPFIPVEFSAAVFRFGHSMLRTAYNYNSMFSNPEGEPESVILRQLLEFTGTSDNFRVPLFSNWIIDWRRFFDFNDKTVKPNPSRVIDPFLPRTFPINLAAQDLQKGMRSSLPSGQSVARFLDIEPLSAAEIASGEDGKVAAQLGFDHETPLWYYILKEAEQKNHGICLGDVGSRILAEVLIGLLEKDSESFLVQNRNWRPILKSLEPHHFSMVDLLNYVDDINPIDAYRD